MCRSSLELRSSYSCALFDGKAPTSIHRLSPSYTKTLILPNIQWRMFARVSISRFLNRKRKSSFWKEIKAFETQLKRTEGLPEYVFYDGPPFATGEPHFRHILAGTIKDIVTRYMSMTGHHVNRRFGWDCHGLPVENKADTKLGIVKRSDVLKFGIDKYDETCRRIVDGHVQAWEDVVLRSGRWIDMKEGYKTMDTHFMETVWWVFAQLYQKGLVYQGFKVLPYSTGCKTVLSNFEAVQNYKEVQDPEVFVTFPVVDDPNCAALAAWITTLDPSR